MGPERVEVEVDGRRIGLSNLDKVLYPATGFTKAQVVDYYRRVAPVLLPHLAGRGVTLVRFPDGVEAEGFFEKNCPQHRPEWMSTTRITGRTSGETVEFCLVDELAALVWLANLAALELHAPMATAGDIDHPTAVVFDLDPGPPAGLTDACRLGLVLRDLLAGLDLRSFPKTSGKKGLHVYVPLNQPASKGRSGHAPSHQDTRDFAHAIAQLLAKRQPDVITVMERAKRARKVFIDWSQNARHKTTVVAYSLRATPAPSVSTPLEWHEVEVAADGGAEVLTFTPETVMERVEGRGDPFAPVLELRQALPARGTRAP
ncbi:MAG: ATP-dependent DNA ligase [Actinobacteria bacterium]|nr:ATP-dependent DNA ligase [Actinomycetota bacterium]